MQRNWDIIRKILLKIEVLPTEESEFNSQELDGIDNEATACHMRLLLEAKLIAGSCRDALGAPYCRSNRLTWDGHEFLDKIKNETVWNQVKTNARSDGIDLSFTVIKDIASALIISALSL